MYKLLLYSSILGLCEVLVKSQTISNTRLVDHTSYARRVVEEVIKTVEAREWCNLKLPEIRADINENIFEWEVLGSVTYANGFVVSIQRVDILQSSVQQVWRYVAATNLTTVEVRATVQMHGLHIGYDAAANLNDGFHRYTATYTHPLVPFLFTIIKNLFTEEITVTVELGFVARNTAIRMAFIPNDEVGQVLSFLYNDIGGCDINGPPDLCGIREWTKEFQPILLDVVMNKVPFPTICYNCAVTS